MVLPAPLRRFLLLTLSARLLVLGRLRGRRAVLALELAPELAAGRGRLDVQVQVLPVLRVIYLEGRLLLLVVPVAHG